MYIHTYTIHVDLCLSSLQVYILYIQFYIPCTYIVHMYTYLYVCIYRCKYMVGYSPYEHKQQRQKHIYHVCVFVFPSCCAVSEIITG